MMAKSQAQATMISPSPCPLTIVWGNTGKVIHATLGEAIEMALERQEEALPEKVRIKKQKRRERMAAEKAVRDGGS